MERNIYKKVINKFGEKHQILLAIQEMSELTKELTNYLMGRHERIIDLDGEMADVEVVLEELKIIFKNKTKVALRKKQKKKRLKGILNA